MRKLILAVIWMATEASGLAQTTWYVDVNNTPPGSGTIDDPYTSIQYAIDQPATMSGDTLLVLPGTYFENVEFHGRSLILASSQGPDLTVLDGRNLWPVLRLKSVERGPLRIEGFTIQNGLGLVHSDALTYGGGVHAIGADFELQRWCPFGKRAQNWLFSR